MIFFDLDDTLLDFKTAERNAIKAFYRQFGGRLKRSEETFVEDWVEVGKMHFGRFLRGELSFDQQKIERMMDLLAGTDIGINRDNALAYFGIYLQQFEENWVLFEDVLPCLDALRGRPLGIITNGDPVQQRRKLEHLRIADYFQVVVVSGEVGVSKPDPGIFLEACRVAGRKPQECIMIGDSLETDILACEKVGMKGVWLNRRNDDRHARTIRSLTEIGRYVE
jgi:putative hydrolase of the HAD superfamily